MFMLILVNNLFGIIPPVQYPTMSRIGFPIALTLLVFVVYHAVGIQKNGAWGHIKHMIPPGLPKGIYVLIIPLELLTYFVTRPLTLALRLFGNMFAGHMLLLLFITGGEYMLIHGGLRPQGRRCRLLRHGLRADRLRGTDRVPAGLHLHAARSAPTSPARSPTSTEIVRAVPGPAHDRSTHN